MMQFGSLDAFVMHLATMAGSVDRAAMHGLDIAGRIIHAEAKAEIGTYQGAASPFAAWAPLAEATKADRVANGFPEDEPLLRTGEMRDSIGHTVDGLTVAIGSNSEIAVYQELGTAKIPPRSFLGGAAVRKTDDAVDAVAQEVVMALASTTARPNSWK